MKLRALAASVATCVLMLGGAISADAAAERVYYGDNWSTYRYADNVVVVHDGDCNNLGVKAQYKWEGITNAWKDVKDHSGCNPPNRHKAIDPPRRATGLWLRTCENWSDPNCSDKVRFPK